MTRRRKPYACKCSGGAARRKRWVVLSRGAKSLLKCLACGWRWKSNKGYVADLPDHEERSRGGMTDLDILARINDGTLRVCPREATVEVLRRGVWVPVTVIPHNPQGKGEYDFVKICHRGRQKKITVHRLVWMFMYRQVVPDWYTVDHVFGKAAGNGIGNLQLLPAPQNHRGHDKPIAEPALPDF